MKILKDFGLWVKSMYYMCRFKFTKNHSKKYMFYLKVKEAYYEHMNL